MPRTRAEIEADIAGQSIEVVGRLLRDVPGLLARIRELEAENAQLHATLEQVRLVDRNHAEQDETGD